MELKACPFCGASASMSFSAGAWDMSCSKCPASMLSACGIGEDYEPSRDEAAAKWNRRATP